MSNGGVDVGVYIVIKNGGKVLFVRHNYGPNKLSLPGGRLEKGELANLGAIRELEEESGSKAKILGLIGIFTQRKRKGFVILFFGEVAGGTIRPEGDGAEISECFFANPHELNTDDVFPAQLAAAKRGLEYKVGDPPIYDYLIPSPEETR